MSSKNSLFWERWLPHLVPLVFIVPYVVFRFWLGLPEFKTDLVRVYEALATYSAIYVGFVATLFGILFSIKESKALRPLMQSTADKEILKGYFRASIFSSFILITVCMFCIAFGHVVCGHGWALISGLTMLFAWSLALLFRIIHIMHSAF